MMEAPKTWDVPYNDPFSPAFDALLKKAFKNGNAHMIGTPSQWNDKRRRFYVFQQRAGPGPGVLPALFVAIEAEDSIDANKIFEKAIPRERHHVFYLMADTVYYDFEYMKQQIGYKRLSNLGRMEGLPRLYFVRKPVSPATESETGFVMEI